MNKLNYHGFVFLDFINITEKEMDNYQSLAGSFAVIKCDGKFLMCYNIWRKQWELPAGTREREETPKECAIRELYEETGQVVPDMEFKGLLKSKNTMSGEIKFNPVYFTTTEKIQPFKENEEIAEIKLWDLEEEIGYLDSLDRKILDYI
ncbi:NUDIX hydrolase [Lysinibacillus sp. SGAir0095]|uniref:NUDIX hydrolase n=1 Tax=Lysinibacillus sp. SGAir0095 TaxID=2070463 RepID=UPI0010CD064A|nr:NUDIX hydrolase [Lysinibacillus sp. SGAir0095]QCR33094.1 DNA mismatch repair protein MutT [Lysinibacillus sp. SGAir0095]